MQHEMKIKAIYFDKIKNGEKVYEVRLNDEKRRLMKIGDDLILKREPEQIVTLHLKIKNLLYFKSFQAMAAILPAEQIGFAGMNHQAIVDVYHEFYTPANEEKFGVVAIQVEESL